MLSAYKMWRRPRVALSPALADGGPRERLLERVQETGLWMGEPISQHGALAVQKSLYRPRGSGVGAG